MGKTFFLPGVDVFTVTIDPPSISANTATNVDVTVTGRELDTTDIIIAIPPSDLETGLVPITALVTASNTIRVRLHNVTTSAIDGAAKTWTILRIKRAVSQSYPSP